MLVQQTTLNIDQKCAVNHYNKLHAYAVRNCSTSSLEQVRASQSCERRSEHKSGVQRMFVALDNVSHDLRYPICLRGDNQQVQDREAVVHKKQAQHQSPVESRVKDP